MRKLQVNAIGPCDKMSPKATLIASVVERFIEIGILKVWLVSEHIFVSSQF